MSDDLMVQGQGQYQQRPSIVGPTAIGAVLGAGVGVGAATLWPKWGVFNDPYAKDSVEALSIARQELVNAQNSKDTFLGKRIEKNGDDASAAKNIQDEALRVNQVEKEMTDYAGELANSADLKAYVEAFDAAEKSKQETLEKLIRGEIKIGEGSEAKTLLEINKDAILTEAKNADGVKDIKLAVKGGEPQALKDLAALTDEQFAELTKNEQFKKFLESNKTFKELAMEADAYKAAGNEAKLTELAGKIKETDKFNLNEYITKRKNFLEAEKKGQAKITTDMLSKVKKPSWWKNGLLGLAIGGTIAAVIALATRSKDQ